MLAPLIDEFVSWFSDLFPPNSWLSFTFNVYALLALILVCFVCGAVGSMVVGNRMAFFSDALSHCAFAGVAVGILLAVAVGVRPANFPRWVLPIMIAFGVLIGVLIAFVRERTSLSNDTVIGVFFAAAIGLGAMLMRIGGRQGLFNLEQFLFGDPLTARGLDIELLLYLAILTALILYFLFNQMVFASFSPSLARSRQMSIRLCHYLFIVLLAVIVNLCVFTAGVMLINAMLLVPAATAALLSRNMRQFFARSVLLCLLLGVGGQWLSWQISSINPNFEVGIGGTIVVLSVLFFFVTLAFVSLKPARHRSPT